MRKRSKERESHRRRIRRMGKCGGKCKHAGKCDIGIGGKQSDRAYFFLPRYSGGGLGRGF